MINVAKAESLKGQLPSMPIDAKLIREGDLDPRGLVATQSQDQLVTSGVWSCEVGVFDYTYGWDEFVYILEGEVEITESTGEVHRVVAGDMAHFRNGTKVRWRIIKPIRKVFVVRTPEPLKL